MSRPTEYTDEMADLICTGLIEGNSLRSICADEAFPDKSTVFRWLSANKPFATKYARAREIQGDLAADEMQEVADKATPENVHVARLRVATMQWRASKLAPKRYGDKLALTGGSEDDAPIRTVRRIERVIRDPGTGNP